MPTVLLVDDDDSLFPVLDARLRRHGYRVVAHPPTSDVLERLSQDDLVDVVLTDLNMPGPGGIAVCEQVSASRPDVPVVVLTGHGSMDAAVAAMRAGAFDFVSKPVPMHELVAILDRAIERRRSHPSLRRLPSPAATPVAFEGLIGQGAAMHNLVALIERVAGLDTSVFIRGESGTGKELVARALHQRSPRADHPFVAVNCASLPEGLLESELFGHVRGAFTDARRERKGLFVQAMGGTLFLDEIAELPLRLQGKLLRAIQERRVRPVGAEAEISCDVRLITASHRDLKRAVEQDLFRGDLYYRINVLTIDTPPLRERGDDVLLLAQHFVTVFAREMSKAVQGFDDEVANALTAYRWPGNVRELRNVIERAVALADYERLTVRDLPEELRAYRRRARGVDAHGSDLLPLAEIEQRHIRRVLDAVDGNRTEAARILRVSRRTLHRRLAELKDDPPARGQPPRM